MSGLKWLAFAAGVSVAVAYAIWWYRTREEPVRGRALAAALRASALSGAWLLLLDPTVPIAMRPGPGAPPVLLDASFSMSRPAGEGGAGLWSLALDTLPGVEGVWLFGDDRPRYRVADSLPEGPLFTTSRLAPAVRTIAATGASRVVIVSDGGIADSSTAAEALKRHGLSASFVELSARYPQAGIARVDAPLWLEEGEIGDVEVEVLATADGADSLTVQVVDARERVLASQRVSRPALGRFAVARLPVRVSGEPGYHRLLARLVGDTLDQERRDDQRPFYVQVTDRPGGPLLISLQPDWEVSFLLPHLDRLTDVPALAYALVADSLVRLEGYRRVGPPEVARQARDVPLLVVHGFGSGAPSWLRDLVARVDRVLLFPRGASAFAVPGWGIRVSAPRGGEWYPSDRVPASPVALSLEGISVEDLPPLVRLRSVEGAEGSAPLAARRLRRGEAMPALVMGGEGSRRWAVATGEGYWRWAFRPGTGRELYRALWSGLGGWLLETEEGGAGPGLAPLRRVVERGEALRWAAPSAADSISIVILSGDSTVWRGVTAAPDTLRARLAPGRYRYRARVFAPGRGEARSEGPVEVEDFSSDLLPRKRVVLEGSYGGDPLEATEGRRGLASLGWPFLVIIGLFCAEWAVRRLSGLS